MNSMHGYGEFYWRDGKKYKGFYKNDKKEGFGVYFWAEPNRIYVGFWKNGKQEGLGRYLSSKHAKWGKWKEGERVAWFNSKEDALENCNMDVSSLEKFFQMDLKQCLSYILS